MTSQRQIQRSRDKAVRFARSAYASDMAEDAVQNAYLAALEAKAQDVHGCALACSYNAARNLRRQEKARREREGAWATGGRPRGFGLMPADKLRSIVQANLDARRAESERRAEVVRQLATDLEWLTFKELHRMLLALGHSIAPRTLRGYLKDYQCVSGSVKGFNHNRAERERRQHAVLDLAATLPWATVAECRRQLMLRGIVLDKKTVARYLREGGLYQGCAERHSSTAA